MDPQFGSEWTRYIGRNLIDEAHLQFIGCLAAISPSAKPQKDDALDVPLPFHFTLSG